MRAMLLEKLCSLTEEDHPLRLVDMPRPEPKAHEVQIKVSACGVCHTELDEIEGRAPPPYLPVIPGHEVVGHIFAVGPNVTQHAVGDRVGVGWIHHSDGSPQENLSPAFVATGRDVNGGYAEFMCVPEGYAVPIPAQFEDHEAAPLLCAGAIGYRALQLCQLKNGAPLGLTGFGGSAHLVLQLAKCTHPDSPVYVFARSEESHNFAMSLGADWAGHTDAQPPQPLQAIIDTTPAWTPIVKALTNLRPGGRLVINAIRKEDRDLDALLSMNYHTHLWQEKEIKSVANICVQDIREFLPLASKYGLRAEVQTYPLSAANAALVALKRDNVKGAKVLLMN